MAPTRSWHKFLMHSNVSQNREQMEHLSSETCSLSTTSHSSQFTIFLWTIHFFAVPLDEEHVQTIFVVLSLLLSYYSALPQYFAAINSFSSFEKLDPTADARVW